MPISTSTKRIFLIAFLSSIVACGALGVYCLTIGTFGRIEGAVLGSTAAFGGAAILAFVSAIPWEQRRWHPIGPAGVASASMALVFTLYPIWADIIRPPQYPWSFRYWQWCGASWVMAVAVSHMGLLSLARLHRRYVWTRTATIVLICVLAVALALSILDLIEFSGEVARILGAVGIGVVCGTIATPVLHRMSTLSGRESQKTVELRLTLTCPRCLVSREFSVGRSRCSGCGLKFSIDIEEEQCRKCGYPLYRLESAACPECGTPIASLADSG